VLHIRIKLHNVQVPEKEKAPFAGILQIPLTDSNRRPPPYHGGSGAESAFTPGHPRPRSPCKSVAQSVSLMSAGDGACSTSCTRLVPAWRCLFVQHVTAMSAQVRRRPSPSRPAASGALRASRVHTRRLSPRRDRPGALARGRFGGGRQGRPSRRRTSRECLVAGACMLFVGAFMLLPRASARRRTAARFRRPHEPRARHARARCRERSRARSGRASTRRRFRMRSRRQRCHAYR